MPPDDSCSLKPSRHLLLLNQQHVFPSRARRLRSSLLWNTRICALFAPGSPVAIISTNCCTNTTSSFIPEARLTPSHRASISLFSQCSCSRSRSGWYRLLKLNQLTCCVKHTRSGVCVSSFVLGSFWHAWTSSARLILVVSCSWFYQNKAVVLYE